LPDLKRCRLPRGSVVAGSRLRYNEGKLGGAGVGVALNTVPEAECNQVARSVLAINLRFTSIKLVHAGRILVDGTLVPGAIHVTIPGFEVEATYRLPCDVLHIFVTHRILAQCFEDTFGRKP